MTEHKTTFGTSFLEAFDKAMGRKMFTYAERKNYRSLDRDGVVKKMTMYGYEVLKVAKNDTPRELADFIASRLNGANDASPLDTSMLLLMSLD